MRVATKSPLSFFKTERRTSRPAVSYKSIPGVFSGVKRTRLIAPSTSPTCISALALYKDPEFCDDHGSPFTIDWIS